MIENFAEFFLADQPLQCSQIPRRALVHEMSQKRHRLRQNLFRFLEPDNTARNLDEFGRRRKGLHSVIAGIQ